MSFRALYDQASGRLVSIGENDGTPTPVGMGSLVVTTYPFPQKMWDEGTKTFVDRPSKVTFTLREVMQADPDFQALSAANKNRLIAFFVRTMNRMEIDIDQLRIR